MLAHIHILENTKETVIHTTTKTVKCYDVQNLQNINTIYINKVFI